MLQHFIEAAAAIPLLAVLTVYFVGVFTPGPNNAMLLLSGQRIGFRRTIPHAVGIASGMVGLVLLQGIFFGEVFERVPGSQTALRLIFSVFLLWLAWKIATADPEETTEDPSFPIPFGFWRAFLFQAANPKAWSIVGVIVTNYGSGDPTRLAFECLVIALLSFPISLTSTSLWTAFGVGLRSWLREPRRARIFYRVMAALLVAALAFAWV